MKALLILSGILLVATGSSARCDAAVISADAAEIEIRSQFQLPWDQPPAEFKEMERQGFQAGVEAAANDYEHHRSPEPERRKEYKHPHVSSSFQGDYRRGFVRGYDDAYKHLMKSNGGHS